MMEVKCLGSGSSGNSYLIYDGSSALLLEAGLKKADIVNGYYEYWDKISGCLVTHEHKDHAKSVADLAKLGIDIYSSKGTFEGIGNIFHSHRCNIILAGKQFRTGSYIIMPFETKHDCNEPLGFLIYSTATHERLLFATDTYYIPNTFKHLNIIMVECNYCEKIMKERIEKGYLNKSLALRIQQSHFALENVIDFLKSNDLSEVAEIYLLHLSSDNSDAEMFKRKIQSLTGKFVKIAERGGFQNEQCIAYRQTYSSPRTQIHSEQHGLHTLQRGS